MAVRFSTNVPVKVSFPFGDFLDVNGQYGPQHLYTVEGPDGQRDKLYAAPGLHQELQAAGVGPGSVFTITRIEGEGNRKGWLVQPAEPTCSGASPPSAIACVRSPSIACMRRLCA